MLKPASLIAPVIAVCLLLPVASTPAAAASSATAVTSSAVSAHQRVRLSDLELAQAKAKDLKGYQDRYQALMRNDALVSLLTTAVGAAAADRQVQELAATTTSEMVKLFDKNTRGKSFVATSVNGEWSLALADKGKSTTGATPMGSTVMPQCWQAWVAAFAWYIGTGGICGAVGLATFMVAMVGGFVCWAGLFTAGMVINWNNAS